MRCKWCWILVLGAALVACNRDGDEGDEPQAAQDSARRDSVPRQPVYPEAEAAQILRAINENEIATARVARERTQNDDIMRFANVMMADHRAMTELLDSLVAPVPDSVNAQAKALSEAGTALVDSLWRIQGGFNNTYIENQVREHERTLLLLDTALIPSARTPELKKLLRDLRPAIVAHLQRAKQIYSARMASGLGTPETSAPAARTTTTPAATTPTPTPAAPPTPTPPQPTPPPMDTVPPTSTSNM